MVTYGRRALDLKICDLRLFARLLRQGIHRSLIAMATRRRPNLMGCDFADVDRAVKLVRRNGQEFLSEIVILLCDAFGKGSSLRSQECPHCQHPCEDAVHVLWHSPRWESGFERDLYSSCVIWCFLIVSWMFAL